MLWGAERGRKAREHKLVGVSRDEPETLGKSRRLRTAAVISGTLFSGGEGWVRWDEVQFRECVCGAEKRLQTGHGGFFTDGETTGFTFHGGPFGSFTLLGIRNIICLASPPLLWPVPWFGSLGCVREAVQWWLRQHEQRAAWKLVRAPAGKETKHIRIVPRPYL